MSMYAPYRALGLVCDGTSTTGAAPCVHSLGTASFVTCPVDSGRSLHLYDTDLHLKGVSRPLPSEWIEQCSMPESNGLYTGLAAIGSYTFGASGTWLVVLKEMRPIARWVVHNEPISHLLVVAHFLVTVSAAERRVIVWRIPTRRKAKTPVNGDIVADIFLPSEYCATTVTHPPTYLNKILLGSSDGRLLLLNLRSGKIVHTFPSVGSAITVLSAAPVLDVVAVGTRDGRVILHNIRVDESLFTFYHGSHISRVPGSDNHWEASNIFPSLSPLSESTEDVSEAGMQKNGASISVVSFCTDGSETLVSGDADGNLAIWSLPEKSLLALAKTVHFGGISIAHFFPGEPLLVTAGVSDNAIKLHIFEGPLRIARVLRSREGHRLPPTRVRFSGRDSKMLVSAGLDREVRIVSAIRDSQNRSFSQAILDKSSARVKKRKRVNAGAELGAKLELSELAARLPPVTHIATSSARRRDTDFANVVTLHAKRAEAYTWRVASGAAYKHILRPPPPSKPLKLAYTREEGIKLGQKKETKPSKSEAQSSVRRRARNEATSVVLSSCGNFAVIGLANGSIHAYNLQSGRHLGSFCNQTNRKKSDRVDKHGWGRAHVGPVGGLAIDSCDESLVSGGTVDNMLRFWNMRTREFSGDIVSLPAGVSLLSWNRASNLIAAICNDFGVYIYDGSTHRLARRLVQHSAPVTDLCFDGTGRRVVSSSMDCTLRTWDLPSGRVIDILRCETAPTSVAVSPGGEFIATCHVNSLSIALWVDRSKYDFTNISEPWMSKAAADADTEDLKTDAVGSTDEVALPGAFVSEAAESETEALKEPKIDHKRQGRPSNEEQKVLGPELVTLSGRPTTQWSTLANLDVIKRRNKPIEPPKKPEHVPFFIPTVKGLRPEFDFGEQKVGDSTVADDAENDMKRSQSKEIAADESGFFVNSEFGKLVVAGKYDEAHSLLANLGPSSVDVQLRTLEGSESRVKTLMYFTEQLELRTDFELNQAHLDVFLKAHGRDIVSDPEASEALRQLLRSQEKAFSTIESLFHGVLALASHFSGQI